MFPEMKGAIKVRVNSNEAQSQSRAGRHDREGQALVGFGRFSQMSRQALCNSTKEEHRKFVEEMLQYPVTHPGGQLDKLKTYILKKREEEYADDAQLVKIAVEIEQRLTGNMLHLVAVLRSFLIYVILLNFSFFSSCTL